MPGCQCGVLIKILRSGLEYCPLFNGEHTAGEFLEDKQSRRRWRRVVK